MMTASRLGSALAVLLGIAGVTGATPLRVAVSILPQRAVVERVGGDAVEVTVLVTPGQSPATYEPTPRQMSDLADAAAWITVGVPFETTALATARAVAPDLDVVDGRRGIDLLPMVEEELPGEPHGGEKDPHFWLDPELLAAHARLVRDALAAVAPEHHETFEGNLAALLRDLEAADRHARGLLAPLAGRELLVYHPAFGYFCRRYGLRQVAVEVAGKEPTARQLAQLVERARRGGAPALFAQPQFASRGVLAVAEALDLPVVELDPLAGDPIANLERMAAAIAAAFRR